MRQKQLQNLKFSMSEDDDLTIFGNTLAVRVEGQVVQGEGCGWCACALLYHLSLILLAAAQLRLDAH